MTPLGVHCRCNHDWRSLTPPPSFLRRWGGLQDSAPPPWRLGEPIRDVTGPSRWGAVHLRRYPFSLSFKVTYSRLKLHNGKWVMSHPLTRVPIAAATFHHIPPHTLTAPLPPPLPGKGRWLIGWLVGHWPIRILSRDNIWKYCRATLKATQYLSLHHLVAVG